MGSLLEKNSTAARKRIQSHQFVDEDGEEYSASTFGGFGDYMRRKKLKLQNRDTAIREQSQDKPQIFKNIVAHVNGYTQPSMNDLHHLIVTHGGGYMQYLDGKTSVTHIIASQLTPKKKVEFKRYRVVTPAWVVDSIAAGKMLAWDQYRLYDEGSAQKTLAFGNSGLTTQRAKEQQDSYQNESDAGWYAEQLKTAIDSNSEHGPIEDVIPILNAGDPKPQIDPDYGSLRSALQISQSDATSFNQAMQPDSSPPVVNSQSAASTTDDLLSDDDKVSSSKLAQLKLPDNARKSEHTRNAVGQAQPVPDALIPPANQFETPDTPPTPETAFSPRGADKMDVAVPVGPAMLIEHAAPLDVPSKELTAEQHNALLLQDPHLAKSSTANPDFIDQYYRESRLHHLSTWKAQLKAKLLERGMNINPQRNPSAIKPGRRRYILHVDFDSFFVSVSLRLHPNLRDSPVAIAHGSGPGSEIASCNYPARKHGVKNGMWMAKARELCSNLKVLPYDYSAYEDASRAFYEAILDLDAIVQSISVDEALVDISEQCIRAGGSDGRHSTENAIDREQAKAWEIAQTIRDGVRTRTGCEVSVGIGANILLAKIACRAAKPAGQFYLSPDRVLEHVGALSVQDLPGIGWSWQNKLEGLNIKLVRDIRQTSKEMLVARLGPKTGQKLWDYARGIDQQEVGVQTQRKSVSCEINWGIRFLNQDEAEAFIEKLCIELTRRLVENLVKGRVITLKIMRRAADAPRDPPKSLGHGKCDTVNKSVVLGRATVDAKVVAAHANTMLRGLAYPAGELRGIGVMITRLEPISAAHFQTDQALHDGSQRKLQFTRSEPRAVRGERPVAALRADVVSNPAENKSSLVPAPAPPPKQQRQGIDPSSTIAASGTQFAIPSQLDTSVLAELPDAIRAQIQGQSPPALSQSNDIDLELLAALPDDIRREVQNEYKRDTLNRRRGKQQQLLPQSPRKAPPQPSSSTGVVGSKPKLIFPEKIDMTRGTSPRPLSTTSAELVADSRVAKLVQTRSDELLENLHLKGDERDYASDLGSAGRIESDVESEASDCGDARWALYDWLSDSGSSDGESIAAEEVVREFDSYLDWLELHEEELRLAEEEAEAQRREEELARQARIARGEPEPAPKHDQDPFEAEAEDFYSVPQIGPDDEAADQEDDGEIDEGEAPVPVIPTGPPKPVYLLPRAKFGEKGLSNTRDVCIYFSDWLRSCVSSDAEDPKEAEVAEVGEYLELVILRESNFFKVQTILESMAFACKRFTYPNEAKQAVFKHNWTRWRDGVQATMHALGFPPLQIGVQL